MNGAAIFNHYNPKQMHQLYALCFCLLAALTALAQDAPNIIFMMADDLGNGDLSYNKAKYDTPSIDSLAEAGVYFERFYAYPGCTPTRSALMTGRYPLRQGLWQVVIGRYDDYCLPQSENQYMLPRLLKEVGYQTAIIGKWHLGHMYPECLPHARGFDYQFGSSYGLLDYYDWSYENAEDCKENGAHYPPAQHSNANKYFTDVIAEKCEDYLDSWAGCSSSPFFLFVPFTAPHVAPYGSGAARLQIPADSLVNAPGSLNTTQKRYWVMMKQLDYAVSRIVNKVRSLGIEDNTIIIFASDNGGDVDYAGDNTPFRGEKGDLTEGGICVPAIWYHKNTVTTHLDIATPVQIEDFHPTLLKLAGRDISDIEPNLDGDDIYPLVQGGSIPSRMFLKQYQPVNNATSASWAVINGEYKLCNNCGAGTNLYNVVTDPNEFTDLSSAQPAIRSAMLNFAQSYQGDVVNRSNNNAISPPPGWNTIQKWAVPETFYDPDYLYYRNPKN